MSAVVSPPSEPQSAPALRPTLGRLSLIGLGLGGIIGSGIFVMAGIAARELAGPSVIVSFLVAAIACICAAFCYAELSAQVPAAGSAYSYAHAAFGRFFGWMIGWTLILEYAIAAASVAQGWSHYLADMLRGFGFPLPSVLSGAFDLPALLIALTIAALLAQGMRTSVRVNAAMVVLKLAVVGFVIVAGAGFVHPQNWQPFAPFGWGMARGPDGHPVGMLAGAALAFYAYLGFEAVSVYSEETRLPQRDLPWGILGSILLCAMLYMAVAAVLTGMVPAAKISLTAPVSDAFRQVGLPWAANWIALAALTGITSVLLVILMSLPRILLAMSRDGLLPPVFQAVHPRTGVPRAGTGLVGLAVGLLAALVPLRVLADVVTIATLSTFVVVAVTVLTLRATRRGRPRPFQAPLGPIIPLAAIAACLLLMSSLAAVNWLRLAAWLLLGLAVYAGYGRRHAN